MAEGATYQQLMQKYTAPKLHEVYREGALYRVRSETESSYGINFVRASLANYDQRSCVVCARPLTSIGDDERWTLDDACLYWCGTCKERRPVPAVRHFPERAMPRLMTQVIQQVNDHPDVLQLNHATRQMLRWLSEDQRRKTDDNKYIRDVWLFLYKGVGQ